MLPFAGTMVCASHKATKTEDSYVGVQSDVSRSLFVWADTAAIYV